MSEQDYFAESMSIDDAVAELDSEQSDTQADGRSDRDTDQGEQADAPSKSGASADALAKDQGGNADDGQSQTDKPGKDDDDDPEDQDEDDTGDDQADGDQDEDQEGDQDEGEESDQDEPEAELHTVKVDGQERQVSLDELKSGYSLAKASHERFEKAQELTDEASQAFEVVEFAAQRGRDLIAEMQTVEAVLTNVMIPEDQIEALRVNGSAQEALEAIAFNKQQQKVIDQTKAKAEAIRKEAEELETIAAKKRANEGYQALLKAVPEWHNPEVQKADLAGMEKHAIEAYGFTKQELQEVPDHRLLLLLRDAYKGRLQALPKPKRAKSRPAMKSSGRKTSASSRAAKRIQAAGSTTIEEALAAEFD